MNRTKSALDFIARLPGMPSDDGVIEQVRDVLRGSGFRSLRLSLDADRPNEGPVLLVGWNRDDLRRHLAETGAAATDGAADRPAVTSAPPAPSARLQRRPRAGKALAVPTPAALATPWTVVSATPSADTSDDGAPTDDEIAMLRLLADLVRDRLNRVAPVAEAATERPLLSPREHECLKWTAAGKTTWEIAAILAISQNTTDGYIASATRKLGAVNRTQAVAEALRRGFID